MNDMLFADEGGDGSSPEDVQPKKGRKKKSQAQTAPDAAQQTDTAPEPFAPPPTNAVGYIGRVSDSGTKCRECGADEYDVDEERGGTLSVECAFCGALLTIKKPPSFRVTRIQSGQLAGLTVAHAVRVNRRIVEHLAKSSPEIREELERLDGATVVSQ